MRKHLREALSDTAHNQLAGNLLRQGRLDAGGGKPIKQEAYARLLASKLRLDGIARQTMSAWERGPKPTATEPRSTAAGSRRFEPRPPPNPFLALGLGSSL